MDTAMRFVFYILRKALLVLIVVIILGVTFFAARDVANVFIVVNEGLKNRTSAILDQNVDIDFLNRFFSDDFLRNDELLNSNIYVEYNIYSYRQRVRASLFWIWPWENRATVSVEHNVTELLGESKNVSEGVTTPPDWESGNKEIILRREMGRWQIYSMRLLQ